jgi:hypothetical protein
LYMLQELQPALDLGLPKGKGKVIESSDTRSMSKKFWWLLCK